MKKIVLVLTMSLLTITGLESCDASKVMFGEPSPSEVIYTLQKLLDSSTLNTIVTVSKMSNQGIQGLLPEELQPVLGVLKTTGAIKDIDKIDAKIAEISREVTVETGEILIDAVKQLSFGDAVSVLTGGKSAATQVLKSAMYDTAKKRYSSKIGQELTDWEPNIDAYWTAGASAYNLLAKNKVDSSLPDFLAERSIDLLFTAIGENEAKIREQPQQLGDQIVNRVFDFYKNR